MKKISLLFLGLGCLVLMPNCAPMSSAQVNSQRGQSVMLTSKSQLDQNRVQRANEREEASHGNHMRNESILGPLDTANRAVGGLHGLTRGVRAFGYY